MTKQVKQVDFLVIGGGIAGLQAAITLSDHGGVLVVNKGGGCSPLAQGGVAVALAEADRHHLEDTLRAGKGECDAEVVRLMVHEGPARIADLIHWGAQFDRDQAGDFALAREAAHSRRRILRAGGDATGREMMRALHAEAAGRDSIQWVDGVVSELLTEGDRVVGALLLTGDGGPEHALTVVARAVLMASGGAGQVYSHTSNPETATGDGIAMAMRAGAGLRHMEFVQFHPTVLAAPYPQFLLSEAMRGEGGILVNAAGEAFMERYHPQRELAPRDDVSRAIWREMQKTGADYVGLDMRCLAKEELWSRFPTISKTCKELGLDISRQIIPVAPSAHFLMGGVRVDRSGRAGVSGLYATGEVACSGVHGANRLASNSLLEALVFGARSGRAMARDTVATVQVPQAAQAAVMALQQQRKNVRVKKIEEIQCTLQALMWEHAGLIRNGEGLGQALGWIDNQLACFPRDPFHVQAVVCLNLLQVARAIAQAALARTKGVGAHYRSDSGQAAGQTACAG